MLEADKCGDPLLSVRFLQSREADKCRDTLHFSSFGFLPALEADKCGDTFLLLRFLAALEVDKSGEDPDLSDFNESSIAQDFQAVSQAVNKKTPSLAEGGYIDSANKNSIPPAECSEQDSGNNHPLAGEGQYNSSI